MKLRTFLLGLAAVITTGALIAAAQVPGVNSNLNAVFTLAYDNGTMKPTFSASTVVVPATTAQDVCTLTGSATRNVRVRRIILAGLTDAVKTLSIAILKRSTANSGGTSTTPTVVPYDSVNSLTNATNAGTAVFRAYTANPTLGTLVGVIADPLMTWNNLTTGAAGNVPLVLEFGITASPIVLRGVTQVLAVNLNNTTYTTPQLSCTFEWTEE